MTEAANEVETAHEESRVQSEVSETEARINREITFRAVGEVLKKELPLFLDRPSPPNFARLRYLAEMYTDEWLRLNPDRIAQAKAYYAGGATADSQVPTS